jgi:hypothetical protein
MYASGKTEVCLAFTGHWTKTHHVKAFMTLYAQILDNAGDALGIILRHIRDHPTEGFLIYCTGMSHGPFLAATSVLTHCVHSAGKDRTGIFAAIILKVLPPSNRLVLSLKCFPSS